MDLPSIYYKYSPRLNSRQSTPPVFRNPSFGVRGLGFRGSGFGFRPEKTLEGNSEVKWRQRTSPVCARNESISPSPCIDLPTHSPSHQPTHPSIYPVTNPPTHPSTQSLAHRRVETSRFGGNESISPSPCIDLAQGRSELSLSL